MFLFLATPRLLYVTKEESPVYRQPGSTFRFQCVATGYPKPEMMWYKDGVPVSRLFRIGRWALKFTKAMTTDSGNYTCVATNLLGTASHSWNLVVDGTSFLYIKVSVILKLNNFRKKVIHNS